MNDVSTTSAQTTPLLFTPMHLRSIVLPNRIVVSPMCQYSSVNGHPTDWHLVHLGKFATGGAGLIFGEETAIEPRGRKTYGCAGLWQDSHILAYRRLNAFISQHGSVPAIQLGHAGGKASCHGARMDWAPLTPSSAQPGQPPWTGIAPSKSAADAWPQFEAMTRDDVKAHLNVWREATHRAADADYKILEIHGAHGYLIHQFLSPITNTRSDAYGGDREARMRFALEITEVVRDAWPKELPLFFRISTVDGKGGAWNLKDSVVLSRALKERGVDIIDCSSGGISGNTDMPIVRRVPGYQVDFARTIRKKADIPTMAVGLITEAQQAESILANQDADLVALARELIWNPYWPAHAAKTLMGNKAYELLPNEYAHRLLRREAVARLPINATGAFESDDDDALTETT